MGYDITFCFLHRRNRSTVLIFRWSLCYILVPPVHVSRGTHKRCGVSGHVGVVMRVWLATCPIFCVFSQHCTESHNAHLGQCMPHIHTHSPPPQDTR